MMRPGLAAALLLGVAEARKGSDSDNHRHGHTYLQFCTNATYAFSHACISEVTEQWSATVDPELDVPHCKEATAGHAQTGTTPVTSAGGKLCQMLTFTSTGDNVGRMNIYNPILIPQNIRAPLAKDADHDMYRHGTDVDTLTTTDRVRCRDGHLFSTSFNKRYTPAECSRLCARIHNWHGGLSCTHFSRSWLESRLAPHDDNYGRDGDDLEGAGAGGFGRHRSGGYNYGSAGVGDGSYKFKAQCSFYYSLNDECCATQAAYNENSIYQVIGLTASTDGDYCKNKQFERVNNFGAVSGESDKVRSWRIQHKGFTPATSWPIHSSFKRLYSTSSARRMQQSMASDEVLLENGRILNEYDMQTEWHELIYLNGTRAWAHLPPLD